MVVKDGAEVVDGADACEDARGCVCASVPDAGEVFGEERAIVMVLVEGEAPGVHECLESGHGGRGDACVVDVNVSE